MTTGAAVIRYSLRQPFEKALRSIRSTLGRHGLAVVGQVDVSKRVERSLGIGLPACRIVLVLPVAAREIDAAAATYLPLHVVVSSKGAETDIQILNRIPRDCGAEAAHVQAQVCEALESVAMRRGVVA